MQRSCLVDYDDSTSGSDAEAAAAAACGREGEFEPPHCHYRQQEAAAAGASSSSSKKPKLAGTEIEHAGPSRRDIVNFTHEDEDDDDDDASEDNSWTFSHYCYDYEEEDTASGNEKKAEKVLLEMGFKAEHVSAAIKACGRDSSVFILSDFIEAHYGCCEGPEMPGIEVTSKLDDEDGDMVNAEMELLDMGFPPDHVAHAITVCGSKSSIFELSDFIQAHFASQEEKLVAAEQKTDEKPLTYPSSDDEADEKKVAFNKLKQMGFAPMSIWSALRHCGSCELDKILEFLVEGADAKWDAIQVERSISCPAGSSVTPKCKWSDKRPVIEVAAPIQEFHSSTSSDSENYIPAVSKKNYKRVSYKKQMELKVDLTACVRQRNMKGFGLPGSSSLVRHVPAFMEGPPFFYFENVATMPKSQWDTIKRHFNGIDPEFVDSKYFSATRRPRGYVHNLPLEGRKEILPTPPMTIEEALPSTKRYWPSWDRRNKMNCLHTRRGSNILCTEIRTILTKYEGRDLPLQEQQFILHQLKKWNLVWVGPGQVAPLEPHEMELLLGFDRDHTRGCSTASERYQALGNSFQINTIAYHLSVLRPLYPTGITVLSLFSGIGGAEVALHKLGIYLKCVVVVEIDHKVRSVISSWWKKTEQKGRLILKDDVRDLTNEVLVELIQDVGGFDLIIGGSPCNNLSGNNRVSRTGLEGKESSVFYEFPRILNIVKQIMQAKCHR